MPSSSTPAANAAAAQSRTGKGQASARHKPRGRAEPDIDFTVGLRVTQGTVCRAYDRKPGEPVYRPLRIYALDPSASVGDGAIAVVNVPYEPLKAIKGGVQGAILQVFDKEQADKETRAEAEAEAAPAAKRGAQDAAMKGVDLDDSFVLMQRGRLPSPEDPHFKQQMVYAVASTTYSTFRHALGRDLAWGIRRGKENTARLRILPAIEQLRNAFYEPGRGEVQFGTFTVNSSVHGRNVPGGCVSLCLSHDIVVHELSHALLDGLRSHFLHPSNLDVLAFHEGFADLIAIFQRFTYRDVVSAAILSVRGDLSGANLLTQIGVQFAQAMDVTGALRSAVGTERRYEDTTEPHQRGEILINAVFDAFKRVYERKTAPLFRLATDGTGVLKPGQIPDGLLAQLTDRASGLASQFLAICIRAIDYCPPVDITFGEFLRAVLTADADLVPQDDWAYREAWIDAFSSRRIYPLGVLSLSESELRWKAPGEGVPPEPELSFAQLRFDSDPGRAANASETLRQAHAFGQLAADPRYHEEFGLVGKNDPALDGDDVDLPVVESVRSSRRVGPSGQVVFDLIAEITQRRSVRARDGHPGFDFFGGATVILGPEGNVRYVVRKSILDNGRLAKQRDFLQGDGARFFGVGPEDTRLPQSRLLMQLHEVTRPLLSSGAGTRAMLRNEKGDAEMAAAQPYLLRIKRNEPAVRLLKVCLNRCVEPSPGLVDSTLFDEATENAVSRLQGRSGGTVDGMVGPATWAMIGRKLGHRVDGLPMDEAPDWVRNLLLNDARSARLGSLDVAGALRMYEFGYGALSVTQRAGLTFLLDTLRQDTQVTDLRWAAYMLATVKHECADTWRPIEEFGKGKGRPYDKAWPMVGADGKPVLNVYYGRGYVQLTWKDNYQAIGEAIGLGNALVTRPEMALTPATAYAIMSYGMRNGTFTRKRLDQYINAEGTDYDGARRIINGTDRAQMIAGYARRIETMLLANVVA